MKTIRRIWNLVRPYQKYGLANVLFNLLSTIFSLVSLSMIIPFLRILFRDSPFPENKGFVWQETSLKENFELWVASYIGLFPDKLSALLGICGFVLVVFFFKNIFRYLALIFLAVVRNGVVKDLRERIFNRAIYLPVGFINENRKGDLLSRAGNDLVEVEWGILGFLESTFKEPFNILVFLTTLVIISPWLTILVLLVLPFTGWVIFRIGKSLKSESETAQAKTGRLLSIFEESLSGLRIIKAFQAEPTFLKSFKKENQELFWYMNRILWKRDLASPVSEFLSITVVILILFLGGRFVLVNQGLEPETFIFFLVVFSQIIPPAKSLATGWYNIMKGMASLDRIEEVLHTKVSMPDKQNPLPFNTGISFRNLTFQYEDQTVLNNVSFEVPKGKVIAIVGQSGSGKSTLVDLALGFHKAPDNSIFLDGQPLENLNPSQYRPLYSYVSQDSILFHDTIYNNLKIGKPGATEDELITAAQKANALEFISQKEDGWETIVGDMGAKLSGGEKQRLALARAVLKDAPIFVLDEATSNLDAKSEKMIRDALESSLANKTAIIIAHRLATIQFADNIIVLKNGKIVEEGDHEKLIAAQGEYFRLVELQLL